MKTLYKNVEVGVHLQYTYTYNAIKYLNNINNRQDVAVLAKLKKLYGDPRNIDLWVGAILEVQPIYFHSLVIQCTVHRITVENQETNLNDKFNFVIYDFLQKILKKFLIKTRQKREEANNKLSFQPSARKKNFVLPRLGNVHRFVLQVKHFSDQS